MNQFLNKCHKRNSEDKIDEISYISSANQEINRTNSNYGLDQKHLFENLIYINQKNFETEVRDSSETCDFVKIYENIVENNVPETKNYIDSLIDSQKKQDVAFKENHMEEKVNDESGKNFELKEPIFDFGLDFDFEIDVNFFIIYILFIKINITYLAI
jgi:hypothetical protein